jgi:hypothetical protein
MTLNYTFKGHKYEIDEDGTIVSLGKFEGSPIFVLHFWSLGMDGGADEDDEGVWWFNLTDEDEQDYPALGNAAQLGLWTDENGFVYSKLQGIRR